VPQQQNEQEDGNPSPGIPERRTERGARLRPAHEEQNNLNADDVPENKPEMPLTEDSARTAKKKEILPPTNVPADAPQQQNERKDGNPEPGTPAPSTERVARLRPEHEEQNNLNAEKVPAKRTFGEFAAGAVKITVGATKLAATAFGNIMNTVGKSIGNVVTDYFSLGGHAQSDSDTDEFEILSKQKDTPKQENAEESENNRVLKEEDLSHLEDANSDHSQ
jgi:hypothetical protein